MGKIVAIGGGGPELDMSPVRKRIIALSGRTRPKVLCIPTASSDNEESWEYCRQGYSAVGGQCDVLWLIREQPAAAEIRRKIRQADVIAVGGGNTLMMMRRWAFLGVDAELRRAYRRGVVLSGGSAGAICWFEYGHSDSMRGYGHDPWEYIRVSGMGLLRGTFCPHYHYENRVDDFHAMVRRKGGFGIACDDACALEVVDGHYKVLAATPDAKTYTVIRRRGQIVEREVKRTRAYRPLADLYANGMAD